jgi:predicted nucleic acid-binding protein
LKLLVIFFDGTRALLETINPVRKAQEADSSTFPLVDPLGRTSAGDESAWCSDGGLALQRAQRSLPKSRALYSGDPGVASCRLLRPNPPAPTRADRGRRKPVPTPLEPAPEAGRPSVVLDTNSVFDWLVFRDASAAAFAAAIEGGTLRWLASAGMRDECEHTLGRGLLDRWSPDAGAIAQAWDRHAILRDAPGRGPLRCTDPDDQQFIDFALAHRANWLITRDRALLKLRRKAAALGLQILAPRDWPPAGLPHSCHEWPKRSGSPMAALGPQLPAE